MTQAASIWIPMTGFSGYNSPSDGDSIYLLLTVSPTTGQYIKLLGMFNTVTTRWIDPVTSVPLINQNIVAYFPTPALPAPNQQYF